MEGNRWKHSIMCQSPFPLPVMRSHHGTQLCQPGGRVTNSHRSWGQFSTQPRGGIASRHSIWWTPLTDQRWGYQQRWPTTYNRCHQQEWCPTPHNKCRSHKLQKDCSDQLPETAQPVSKDDRWSQKATEPKKSKDTLSIPVILYNSAWL